MPVIPFRRRRKRSTNQITQQELAVFEKCHAAMRGLIDDVQRRRKELYERLACGASIEPGELSLHAELGIVLRESDLGRCRKKKC